MRIRRAAGAVDGPGPVLLGLHSMVRRSRSTQRCEDLFQIVRRMQYGFQVGEAQADCTDRALVTVTQITLEMAQDAGITIQDCNKIRLAYRDNYDRTQQHWYRQNMICAMKIIPKGVSA